MSLAILVPSSRAVDAAFASPSPASAASWTLACTAWMDMCTSANLSPSARAIFMPSRAVLRASLASPLARYAAEIACSDLASSFRYPASCRRSLRSSATSSAFSWSLLAMWISTTAFMAMDSMRVSPDFLNSSCACVAVSRASLEAPKRPAISSMAAPWPLLSSASTKQSRASCAASSAPSKSWIMQRTSARMWWAVPRSRWAPSRD
mmetsp:Transcript_108592/g.338549  ORF Transcript_108592/g.338549 Transcript_108592/m.338549 type:complete len:207 (+) Transcript_108592:662-1282(+)